MAKPKQKSGLGRGLNALFDAAEPTAPVSQPEPKPERKPEPTQATETKKPTTTQTTPTSTQTSVENSSAVDKSTQQSPSSQSGTPKEKPVIEEAHDIIFSDEALENAKVVEREARRPQPQRSVVSPKKKPLKPSLTESLAASRSAKAAREAQAEAQVQTQPQTKTTQSSSTPTSSAVTASSPKPASASTSNVSQKPTQQSVQSNPEPEMGSIKAQAEAAKAKVATPTPTKKTDEKGEVGEVALVKIKPNPDQPRTSFKKDEIAELAASIKRDGLLQPILVRKRGETYEIIAGERRYQACKLLGMETIPVRYWSADSDKALELALIENIQRSDLNPIEEAYGYKRLMERKGMTQSEVAQTVSKGRSTIANALRLLELPEEAQQLLFEEKITAGHARAILSIPSPEGRKTLTKKLMEEKLSVREAESIARLFAGKEAAQGKPSKRQPAPPSFKKAARGLTRLLETPVRVKTVQGKNKIEIPFETEEDLMRIVEAISHAKEA